MSKMIFERQHTYGVNVQMIVWECPSCGIVYAIPSEFADHCRRSGQRYYCPNGHSLGWGETDTDRLRKAEAAKIHLADQLEATKAQAEAARVQILRERQRFANGVCPCCNRSFPALARHMQSQHPDYDTTDLKPPTYRCSCGRSFTTLQGLRVHQGRSRPDNWLQNTSRYWQHLTEVGAT